MKNRIFGDAGEDLIAAHVGLSGHTVHRVGARSAGYDLIVDTKPDRLIRISVKATTPRKGNYVTILDSARFDYLAFVVRDDVSLAMFMIPREAWVRLTKVDRQFRENPAHPKAARYIDPTDIASTFAEFLWDWARGFPP